MNRIIRQEQMHEIAQELCASMPDTKIFTFSGPLGAGKTTLVQQILRACGITEPITSPTYTYVNVYRHNDNTYYHFDLYRLEGLDDFIQAGFDEYLYQPNSYCFIEWPEIMETLLKESIYKVTISYDTEVTRLITMEKNEQL